MSLEITPFEMFKSLICRHSSFENFVKIYNDFKQHKKLNKKELNKILEEIDNKIKILDIEKIKKEYMIIESKLKNNQKKLLEVLNDLEKVKETEKYYYICKLAIIDELRTNKHHYINAQQKLNEYLEKTKNDKKIINYLTCLSNNFFQYIKYNKNIYFIEKKVCDHLIDKNIQKLNFKKDLFVFQIDKKFSKIFNNIFDDKSFVDFYPNFFVFQKNKQDINITFYCLSQNELNVLYNNEINIIIVNDQLVYNSKYEKLINFLINICYYVKKYDNKFIYDDSEISNLTENKKKSSKKFAKIKRKVNRKSQLTFKIVDKIFEDSK